MQYGGNKMWNREMVQRKKRLRICNRGGWGKITLPISPRLKWKVLKGFPASSLYSLKSVPMKMAGKLP
mgnify:CR=1 FL=1